jgi:hypothetical protein
MAITTQELIDQVRQKTATTNNQVVTDDEIAGYLSDAVKVLYDIFVQQWQHWFYAEFSFTLAGGVGGNRVALPVDFQRDLGLDLNPTSATPTTVPRLDQFNNRNQLSPWGNFNPIAPGVLTNRRYALNGDELVVLPPLSSQGDYKLFYQAQLPELAVPHTRSFALTGLDTPISIAGVFGFDFANGAFDSNRDVGAVFTVDWDAPNGAWSGTYTIKQVLAPGAVLVNETMPAPGGFSSPGSGPAVVETYQPENSIAQLPQVINPWQLFLKAHASIAVNSKRDIVNPALQAVLDQEHARAVAMSQVRDSNLKQGPLTRGSGLFMGGLFGGDWIG